MEDEGDLTLNSNTKVLHADHLHHPQSLRLFGVLKDTVRWQSVVQWSVIYFPITRVKATADDNGGV